MRKEIASCKEIFREEIEELKQELRKRKEKWEQEQHRKLKVLEEKLEEEETQGKEWKEEIETESVEHKEGVEREGTGELKEIKKVLELKERKERRNNIIIKGLQTEGGQMSKKIEEFLSEKLRIQEKIESSTKIDMGRNNNEGVLVRLSDHKKKGAIMEKNKMLRGTQIFIDDDLTKEERKIQMRLKEKMKEERNKGNRVRIGYQKIEINGV